jgi:serine/threonine-protein kinase RsbW
MADQTVKLTFPARADYLLLARLALSGLGRGLSLDEEGLADLKLAVTEACGNVVRHAYDESADGAVRVVYVVADDRLEMIVEDQGSGLALADIGLDGGLDDLPPPAELSPFEGGMGMAIIRAVVDELEVHDGPDGRGTVVHMTKYLADAQAA